jgi:2-amino-4-hydroxy-6-hydroxymethyldihydropteridine diphosphokinase
MVEERAYLALGANIGDRRESMRTAVRLLREGGACRITAASSLYLTKPVGLEDQPDFLNAVVEVRTGLSPRELLDYCRKIEETMGRQRTIRWGPRVIDIDILLYSDRRIDEDGLVIPHPRMVERAFVLVPLAEIAPDIEIAPGSTARDAVARVGGQGIVKLEESSWCR